MLTNNQECVMINHVVQRRKKHLTQLEQEKASPSTLRVWENFYKRLLEKYNCNEVNIYGS